jgi:hypothetical protein
MRWTLLFAAVGLLSAPLFADSITVDSLPAPVQDSLKGYLQNPQESVENIETYEWGPAVIYKISINLDGKPYLELHIADTGKVLRTDENSGTQDKDDEDANANASPSPSASPKAERQGDSQFRFGAQRSRDSYWPSSTSCGEFQFRKSGASLAVTALMLTSPLYSNRRAKA